MKKIMILLAAIAMTTLTAQANETMDSINSAVEKAIDSVSPTETTDEQKSAEAVSKEKKEALKVEEKKKELEKK